MPASPAGKVFLPNFPSNGKLSGISRWSGGKSSPSNVGVAGSIPGGELRSYIPCGQESQTIKQKQYCNKFNKDSKK